MFRSIPRFSAKPFIRTLHNEPPNIADLSKVRTTVEMRKIMESSYVAMMDVGAVKVDTSRPLEPRSMAQSRSQFVVPLTSDPEIRSHYISHSGAVRFGKLLEDMDYFSCWVCYLHNYGSEEVLIDAPMDRVIVTACVDRIDLHSLVLSSERDLLLDGFVSYAGKTSMESSLRILQPDANGNLQHLLRAKFVMVARDPTDPTKNVPIHPLSYKSLNEAVIFNEGKAASDLRKSTDQNSLFLKPPLRDEIELLHSIFMTTLAKDGSCHSYSRRKLQPNEVDLDDTKMQTVKICFPEFKNIYGKIFGGFLMREAFEVASATTKNFCAKPTEVFAVDDIVFRRPVSIGDTLVFNSHVTFTKDDKMHVRVEAQSQNYDKPRLTTNTFHFSFRTRDGSPVPTVVPREYNQGMMFLNGRRHLLRDIEINNM
uniref:HotDog ACOT-type domain-containing protein n=1 Tax=Panagrellus redivivus TaxID=6233 RepID=A0A7E4URK6_PANRE